MAGKNTPYFELRDALLAGGCPLCRLGDRSALRYIEGVLYEGMTDPEPRNRLRAAQGLCRRHGWLMTRMRTSVLGTAIVYRDVLADLISALERPSESGGLFRSPRAAALPEPALPCPACSAAGDEVLRAGDVLRAHVDDVEIARAYQAAGGLCLPHLRAVLGRSRPHEAETLRRWQLAAYRELRGQLDELIRKHDYRFQAEPIGAEADAWLRAVARLVGEADPDPNP